MVRISPSLLAGDFANLEREVHDIEENGCDWVHVDVMDGIFVPNITIGIPVVAALKRVSTIPLDVHLMIDRPLRYVPQFLQAGADYLTIHVEADSPENVVHALEMIRQAGAKAGISLKPGTPAEAAEPFLKLCDLILVMTVEPGFGGQSFREDMMPKLRKLRQMLARENPDCRLSVDGGINEKTGVLCAENGADAMVMGSAYFKTENRWALVNHIQTLHPYMAESQENGGV